MRGLALLLLGCGGGALRSGSWDPALAVPAAGSVRELPLPAVEEPDSPAPHAVLRLEASADGRHLLVVREGGEPHQYLLLDLATGQPLWEHRDPCCAGPPPQWAVRLAPTAPQALVLEFEPAAQLLVDGALRPLPELGPAARWAADGQWLGGAGGAVDASGATLSGPPLLTDVDLVLPGPTPDTLRLLSEEIFYVWDGRSAPRGDNLWLGERPPSSRLLGQQGPWPVVPSPDGEHVVWRAPEDPTAASLCALQTGEEWPLPATVLASAWTSPQDLWVLVGDAALPGELVEVQLLHIDPQTRAQRVHPLPEGWVPLALAASSQPPVLFLGGRDGRVLRLDL